MAPSALKLCLYFGFLEAYSKMDDADKLLSRPMTDHRGQILPYIALGLPTWYVGGCLSKPRLSS